MDNDKDNNINYGSKTNKGGKERVGSESHSAGCSSKVRTA